MVSCQLLRPGIPSGRIVVPAIDGRAGAFGLSGLERLGWGGG